MCPRRQARGTLSTVGNNVGTHEGRARDERGAREALLDATLEHLRAEGVLAGLNLRAVAETAGVTPANIYHYFGSRRGLLRAAIAREVARHEPHVDGADVTGFVARQARMFDAMLANPSLSLTALLALDGDAEFAPLSSFDRDDTALRPDVDVAAAHFLAWAMVAGMAIYADAAARQLGTSADDLRSRSRTVYVRLLEGLLAVEPRA
jgi:AcrR family transcriptional regulator